MRRVLMMCITSCSTTRHSKIHTMRELHLHTEAFTFYLHAFLHSASHLCVPLHCETSLHSICISPHCILSACLSICILSHCILSTYSLCISFCVFTFSIALTLIQKIFDILPFASHLHDSSCKTLIFLNH